MKAKVLVGCPTSDYHEYCLKEYVKAVKNLTYPNYDILLVDNSKTNKYYEKLKNLGLNVIKDKYQEKARDRIIDSRNILRDYVLKNNYDYFLSLEQDVIPPKDVIEKLLSHKKDVVSGIYFARNKLSTGEHKYIPLVWMFGTKKDKLLVKRTLLYKEIWEPQLLKVIICGMGCVLISRKVLQKIKFRYVKDKPACDDDWFGYDCYEKGIEIYADNTVKCKHLVLNRPWRWEDLKK